MQAIQAKENAALMEKITATELTRVISQTEANSAACTALFDPGIRVSPSSLTFDATSVTQANPFVITVNSIPGIGTSSPPVIRQDSLVSAMSNSLFVPANAIQIRVSSPTSADLVVSFQQNRLVRPIHDVVVRLNLTSTGPLNNTTINGCTGSSVMEFTQYSVADFGAFTSVVTMNQPDYKATEYTIPIAAKPYDRHIAISAFGVWDVWNCGKLIPPAPCQTAVIVNTSVGFCGSNTSTGSSGDYHDVVSTSVSCIIKIPANAPGTVKLLYDARGGAFINLDPSTYNTGAGSASTKIFSLYTLP